MSIIFRLVIDLMKAVFKDNLLLKNTLELFKDAVQCANFKCRHDGIYMQAMDSAHISMTSFIFKTDVFTFFQCDTPIDIGIDMASLYKALKVVTKDDILGLEVMKNDVLSIQIKNPKTEKEWCFDMKLMDIDTEELDVPPLPDGWRVTIDASEFLTNVTTMSDFGDDIEVGCSDGKMFFRVCGDMANAMVGNNTQSHWQGNNDEKQNVLLKFTTKLLKQYGSGKKIAKDINFILAPNHPIMLRYNITENSVIDMFIAPKMSDD